MSPILLSEKADGVLTLTMNRPEVRNAMNTEMRIAIVRAIDEADQDPDVRVVVLTGAGTSFCSGADLKEFQGNLERPLVELYELTAVSFDLYQRMQQIGRPVIAAVNGHALAGGCGLAISCDLVLASDRAEFGFTEINHGIVAALVATQLSRMVGRKKGLELLLRGLRVPAAEAMELGLVNRVVPHEKLAEETRALALDLARKDPLAVQLTKSLFYAVSESPMGPAIQSARAVNVLARQNRSFGDNLQRFLGR